MFNNVLIAEDHESSSISVRKALDDLNISRIHYTYHCDTALASIKASANTQPFDLLITDLSFDDDGQKQQIQNGKELIVAARQVLPFLKVLVFSVEDKAMIIDSLFRDHRIDAYVKKARYDIQELITAIKAIAAGKQHSPSNQRTRLKQINAHEFSTLDITIVSLLAQGMLQKNIPDYLKEHKMRPTSLSTIEKRLSLIKGRYSFLNNEQLVIFCKEMGLI